MTIKKEPITPGTENESTTSEHQIRLEKLKTLEKEHIKPWPEAKEVSATCAQVHQEFNPSAEVGAGGEGKEYSVAGRIRIIRHHGKASFVVIQDQSGQLQLYIKQDDIGQKAYDDFKHLIDVGDIIWAHGSVFKTKMGEITIKVDKFELLSKCLFPLPEKFHGLHDIETIYRQRYLDLITNQESRERFAKRSGIIREFRNYLDNHGFMEVETPMLHPIPGGAAAKPFITHHNALSNDFYLRIAPELYLKRLVVGGFERVYEINRNFRNEGISTRHNPEFTMLEMYWAHHDYHFIMNFVEDMLRKTVEQVLGTLQVPYDAFEFDFSQPFERISIKDAVLKYGRHNGSYTEQDIAPEVIDERLKELDITMANKNASWGEKLYAIFEKIVERRLMKPTFVTEFPIEVSPLAKRDEKNPNFAARFELFIAGMEIANGFNELNDPFDQAARFKQQAGARAGGDVEAHQYDAEYIHALEYGLPPTVGVGIGIDRFAMLVTNTLSIKDVILFPTLKKKE
jgi:lysyl-tRNA synthetase, class II